MKLTNSTVKAIEPPASGYELYWDSALAGFGLRVTAAGAKSFVVQSRVSGRTLRVTIGKFGTLTADQARKLARVQLGEIAAGVDLNAKKREERAKSVTLAEIADDYKQHRQRKADNKPLKESYRKEIDKHLAGILKPFSEKPISGITKRMVEARYKAASKRSPAQANQAMRILSSLIGYAMAKQDDDAKIITSNPVKTLAGQSILKRVEARTSKIDAPKIGSWWSAVTAARADEGLNRASKAAVDLLALLTLTGLRFTEAASLTWDQVDLDDRSLSLADTKNRSDVILPLSQAAATVLEGRPDRSGWVFPARTGKGHIKDVRGQLEKLNEAAGVEITPHDLRRTFIQAGLYYLGNDERIEFYRIKLLSNHKLPKQEVTLSSYANDPDRRYLRADTEVISRYFEGQRAQFEESRKTLDIVS